MDATASDSKRSWPRLVLWALVITFGVVYLNAMRERGIEPEVGAPTRQADTAVAEPGAAGTGKGAVVTADGAIVAREDASAAGEMPESRASAPAASKPAGRGERDQGVATASEPAASPESAAPIASRGSAPQTDQASTRGGDNEPRQSRQAARHAVERRRARLLAEYHALRESVEQERWQVWREMNRRSGRTAWPYPYANLGSGPTMPPRLSGDFPVRPPPLWPGP